MPNAHAETTLSPAELDDDQADDVACPVCRKIHHHTPTSWLSLPATDRPGPPPASRARVAELLGLLRDPHFAGCIREALMDTLVEPLVELFAELHTEAHKRKR